MKTVAILEKLHCGAFVWNVNALSYILKKGCDDDYDNANDDTVDGFGTNDGDDDYDGDDSDDDDSKN